MAVPLNDLTGPEKAVLFLLSLDERVAAPIVNDLSIAELKKLREVASAMTQVRSGALDTVYRDFAERSSSSVAVPRGGLPYLRRLTRDAHGDRAAAEAFDEATKRAPTAFERLGAAPPEVLAGLLADESDQLVAALLAQLDSKQAALALQAMSTEREAAVLMRMSKMSDLPAELLAEVAEALVSELPETEQEEILKVDGVKAAADILNSGGREMSTQVLEQIETEQPELARDMRLAMFTFIDLRHLDPRAMRTLLREVPTERLTIALKGATEELMTAIFAGLSERAANLIRDDLEVLGKVRKSEVDAARQEVVQVALRLEADGVLDLGRGGEE